MPGTPASIYIYKVLLNGIETEACAKNLILKINQF